MRKLISKLWSDDRGALLSAEWVFMATILAIGMVTGLVSVRNAVVGELAEVAGAISTVDQGYGYLGLFIGQPGPLGCCFTAGSAAGDVVDVRQIKQTGQLIPNIDNNICEG